MQTEIKILTGLILSLVACSIIAYFAGLMITAAGSAMIALNPILMVLTRHDRLRHGL